MDAAPDSLDAPIDHDCDLVAHELGLIDNVRALEHRFVSVFVLNDVCIDGLARDRVHTGGGFVQKEQLLFAYGGDALVEFALVAARQGDSHLVLLPAEAEPIQLLLDERLPAVWVDVLDGQNEFDVFAHREEVLEAVGLRTLAHLTADGRQVVRAERHLFDEHFPTRGH